MDDSATIQLAALLRTKQKEETALAEPYRSGDLQADVSDEAMMVQLAEGSREALAILFRRYARLVGSVNYRAVRDVSEADDLVQEVFILVHREANTFDPSKGTARAWILKIAHRRAISGRRYLSSRHFYNRIDLDDLTDKLGDPRATGAQCGDSIEETFGKASFQRVFDELSPNQRETLRLHFFEGYTLAEIALKLGQSRENVKHHYFRGLEQLRKRLFGAKLMGKRTL